MGGPSVLEAESVIVTIRARELAGRQSIGGREVNKDDDSSCQTRPMDEVGYGELLVEIAEDMIATWRATPSPPPVHMSDTTRASLSDAGAVAVVWGWTARVMRMAEFALLLHRSGYDLEAAPILRSILEHAIALPWVADKRGRAYQTLARERASGWARFSRAQSQAWTLEGEAADLLKSASHVETDADTYSEDTLLKTLHCAQAYDLGPLYQAWLLETWSTHATLMSAEPYFEVDGPMHKGTLFRDGRPQLPDYQVIGAIVIAVHTSLVSYERVHPEAFPGRLSDWETTVGRIMGDIQAGLLAASADQSD